MIGFRFLCLAAAGALFAGLPGCSLEAHAAGTISGRTIELPELTAGLLGQSTGMHVRYQGQKKTMGFRYVIHAPNAPGRGGAASES